MTDIAEFLLARIAEDEAVARGAVRWSEGAAEWGDAGEPDWQHIARWDPARVLAECEAKRRIVEAIRENDNPGYAADPDYWSGAAVGDSVLRLLALPYADHPDYDPDWRP